MRMRTYIQNRSKEKKRRLTVGREMVTRWFSGAYQWLASKFSSEDTNQQSPPTGDDSREEGRPSEAQQQADPSPSSSTTTTQQPDNTTSSEEPAARDDVAATTTASGTTADEPRQEEQSTADTKQPAADESSAPVNEELFDNEWRRKAEEHVRLRAEFFKKADEARANGDHAAAAEFVNQAKEHTEKMKEANEKAVEYIMKINSNNTADTIDLHGLRVEEALEQVEKKLKTVTEGVLHVIPGRGSHSVNQQAKIKPKIIEYLKEHNYKFSEDNPGSLTVHLE